MASAHGLEESFPNLSRDDYQIVSDPDPLYNCIAWALGINDQWWWPIRGSYWPSEVPREETVEAFIRAFGTRGFEPCSDGSMDPGFEKIAIYADSRGTPTHAARQVENGRWISKIGGYVDIEHHTLRGLEGPTYGTAIMFLRRGA